MIYIYIGQFVAVLDIHVPQIVRYSIHVCMYMYVCSVGSIYISHLHLAFTFPNQFPMSSREYLYVRRVWVHKNAAVLISRLECGVLTIYACRCMYILWYILCTFMCAF